MNEIEERPLVLVADDDEDVLELIAFRLRRAGYEVITAADGESALQAARESSPALAVLDVMMPALDGIEVTRALRGGDATRDIGIILLTASVEEEDVQRGLDAGADEYIRKPFAARELGEKVGALLRARTSARSRRA